jgi:uncharacterized lipoprotein YddW (UPF0748 family)
VRFFVACLVVVFAACGPVAVEGDGGAGGPGGGSATAGGIAGTAGGVSGGGVGGGSGGGAAGGAAGGGTAGGAAGGGAADGGSDAGRPDAGSSDAGEGDGGFIVTDSGVVLATVSHPRELRGVWVATVSNLDIPSGLSPDAGIAAMRALVERTRDAGLNAIFFQVRPESDAWYQSTLEPWSRYLTGTQGQNPGWDPLDALLSAAHARGVEVHAWVNPYRGLVTAGSQTAMTHVTRTLSSAAITYDGRVTMNPGVPAVRQHVVNVIRDLLDQYDVDGLHFDDYFYPYPAANPYPDDATYQAYRADGGTMTKSNWRRDNVNALVREVMAVVTADHPQVRFGISPFGIWRPNNPPGVTGLDAYEEISCDAVTWMNQGWVDYLAPQLYWATTSSGQPFVPLLTWWANGTMGGRHVFPGHAVYRLGMTGFTSVNEIRLQVNAGRMLRSQGVMGGLHFREQNVRTNLLGVRDLFRDELYATPALPPPLPRAGASATPLPPVVTRNGATLSVSHALPMTARFYALYRFDPTGWTLVDVAGGVQASFGPLSMGTWAVSAVNRGGAESRGVVTVIP